MDQPQLTTSMRASAFIRQCHSAGYFATLFRRGDAERGMVLIRIERPGQRLIILEPSRDLDGGRIWWRLGGDQPLDPMSAAELTDQRMARDPDLWVIDIDDTDGSFDENSPQLQAI